MTPAEQHQLRALDRAILDLVDERLRLLAESAPGDPARRAAVEDLLRRHAGPLAPQHLREIFRAIDAACGEVPP